MRARYTIPLLMMIPVLAFAGEGAESVAEGTGWIVQIASLLAMVLGTTLVAFLDKLMKSKAEEAKKRAEVEGLSTIEMIRYQAEQIIYQVVNNINNQHLPLLVKAVAEKKVTSVDEIKHRLRGLGDEALDQVIKVGGQSGLDLIGVLGKDWLVGKIRNAVDERSPFLGSTSESLLNGGADWLIRRGKDWMESRGIDAEKCSIPIIVPDDDVSVSKLEEVIQE